VSRRFVLGSEMRSFKPLLESSEEHMAIGKLDVDFAISGPAATSAHNFSDVGRPIAKACRAEFRPFYP